MSTTIPTHIATESDTDAIGAMLYDFNTEYDDPTPPPEKISARLKTLLAGDDFAVVLGGTGPDGLAVLRFRPSIWSEGLECYIAELYVKPHLRGQGIGRALMTASIELARAKGADYMDVSTSEDDKAAQGIYEAFGFIKHEGGPDGPIMYTYERDL